MNTIYIPPVRTLKTWKLPKLDGLYWKLFSRWIRLKHADQHTGLVKCFTCGTEIHWTEADCSHYVSRGNACTKYMVKNNHPCCRQCNRFGGGNLQEYKKNIDKVYGAGTAEKIEYLGRQTCKIDRNDYIEGIHKIEKRLLWLNGN